MDIETKRTYIGIRVVKAREDLVRPLDQTITAQIVRDAERFVTRLERYLHQVGAIE